MKKLFTLGLLLFLFSTKSICQQIVWQKTIGGSGNDFLECIIPSKDGGFVISGSSNSNISGDKTENNWDTTLATRDYWVMKIDSIGNIVWQNTIGGTMEDFTASINATTDGGYIIGGTSKSDSSGDKTENGCNTFNGSWDYWVVKIDSIGNILWQNTITANFTDRMYGISQTTDGGFICGGTSHSNISCDKIENNLDYPHNSTSDYWVVKLDSIGNILWQNTIGGGQWCSDHLSSIELTKDGGYICGGSSDGTWAGNDKSEMTKGGYDYWVVKLDSVGNVEWENTIGGASVDYLYSVKQLIDGSYICGGTSKSNVSSDKANPSIGGYDYWIVKLDAFGDIVWQKTIGGNSDDDLDYITPTIDNGFICGGASISSISGLKTEVNLGSGDNWIIKLDSNGNIQWQNTIGGSGNDGLARVFPSYDGNSIICGATSNSGISGDKTENSKGGYDFWIYKINDIEYGSLITGNAFVDNNANSIQDSSENNLQYKRIDLLSHNLWTYTAANGFYNLPVPDSGNFTITPANVNYFTPNPNFHTATFTGTPKLDSLNDFPFQPIGIVNDLQIAVTPISAFRANSNCNYKLDYSNKGNTTLNASIIFYLGDTNYNYVSASVAPSLINSDSIVWNNITLTPWQQENIVVTVYVKNGVAIGTQIFSLCTINPIVGDSVPGDNYGSWKVITTGSFDPNNILVDEDTLITNQLADGASLNYIINFQNTGNDTAFYVKVLNPIDTNRFDLNTFEIVSSSHPFILNYIPWENNMEFKFENILLPDSNIDEANSHGYLCYRIKPKTTLHPNDSLTNFASIYFDSNSPIRTNNAVTRILPPNVYIHLYATVCDNYVSPSGKYTWANSGIYLDTIPVGIGLDSIFIVHLTLNKSFSVIDTNDCENYVSPSGNYLWTTSGIYSDTLINALGCDSIITINLTINKSNSIINVTKCDSLTSPSSNYVWTTSGTYFDTIPNAKGCDSLITINLTIQQPFQINSTILMCQGDSTFLSGSWQTIAGFYFDSLQSIFGCDSFVTTQLIVNQNYNIISSASICSGDSIFIGGAWQFNAGNFVDNYSTLFGCDSIITTVVTVNPIYYSISDISICTGDSIFIGGAWQNVQGNYYDIFSTKLGCDSIFETALNINPVFNFTDTITILLGDSVFAGGAWQTTAGVYTDYYITQNSCDSIVTTVLNVVTGIAEYLSSTFINIKPNPGNGIFTIIFTSSEIKPSQLLIKNIQGQQLFSDDIISNQAKLIDITSLANGVFILQVNTLTRSYYYKLIKK